MNTKFRVGDVVRLPDGTEARVQEVSTRGIGALRVDRAENHGWVGAAICTLLRRPVQVGDVVTWGTCYAAHQVVGVNAAGVLTARVGHVTWDGTGAGAPLRHADGTPIDPPAAATQGAGTMFGIARQQGEYLRAQQAHAMTNRDVAMGLARAAQQQMARQQQMPALYRTAPEAAGVIYRPEWTAEQLARALFETDPRVTGFVIGKSESIAHCRLATIAELAAIAETCPRKPGYGERHDGVLARAYARGIFGYAPETEWTADAWERAEQILDVLRRRS